MEMVPSPVYRIAVPSGFQLGQTASTVLSVRATALPPLICRRKIWSLPPCAWMYITIFPSGDTAGKNTGSERLVS